MEKSISNYFDKMACDWGQRYEKSLLFRMRYQEFKKLIKEFSHTDYSALDYGCGDGTLIKLLISNCNFVVGVDVSNKMRKFACKKFIDFPNVKIRDIDYMESDFFDLVICSSVIEYQEKDAFFLKNITTYLKPGGTLIITFPNRSGLLQLINRYILSRFKKESYINYQKNIYTKTSVKNLLIKARLTPLKLYTTIGIPILNRYGIGELIFCVARKKYHDEVTNKTLHIHKAY